ncbi:MAG TPA: hypothetical protein DCL21_06160 [Alphaproteobacteria bacterium]|nr:hypothetical protein [Alphaproteobacteria bacterium]
MRFVCLCLLLLITSCAKNPATNNLDFVVLDETEEYQIGRDSRKTVSNSKFYKDKEKQKYFRNLAEKVYSVGERPEKDFSFYFVDDDVLNAYAAPGYMFINRGILPILMDEAALMGVMAHEAGHINARHTVKGYSTRAFKNWALGGILSVFKKKNKTDSLDYAYSRHMEYEADDLAVRYLKKMDIPTINMRSTYLAFQKQNDIYLDLNNLNENLKTPIKNKSYVLRTHPRGKDRAARIEQGSYTWKEMLEYYNQDEFYRQLDGMAYGYSGKGKSEFIIKQDNYSQMKAVKDSMSGIYGYKNIAYLKKQGLKITMPELYQARVMSGDPLGYNYTKGIKVTLNNFSDDRNRTSLDVIADLFGLRSHARKDFFKNVKENKYSSYAKSLTSKYTDQMKEGEELFSFETSSNFIYQLLNVNTTYYYIYVKQLDDLDQNGDHEDYKNNFRTIVLSSNSKKSFDEHMLDDILFIKDNLVELTSKQKSKIKPLVIKTKQATGFESAKDLSKDNIPYIHFDQEWFKLFNGLYDEFDMEMQLKQGTWLKLIPNPNKDI